MNLIVGAVNKIERMTKEEKKEKVLKFVTESTTCNGYPPTVREVCEKMGFSSSSTGQAYIDMLRKEGLLSTSPGHKPRTMKPETERYKSFDAESLSSNKETIAVEFELDSDSIKILNNFCNKFNLNKNDGIKTAISKLKYFVE